MKRCGKCKEFKELTQFNKNKYEKDGHRYNCRKCANTASTKYGRGVYGSLPMRDNKECASYLGVAVAEKLFKHLFKDVVRMPYGYSGYDFICMKDMKIDVKSSCVIMARKKYPHWQFGIKKNKIADYFLLLAFNNRSDLEPQHQWLIPGDVLNHLMTTTISPSTIDKWDKYRQPIDQARICCTVLKA